MLQPPRSRASTVHEKRGEGVRTIVIALGANLLIAAAKLVAGLVAHSTAMLAESAHSLADSLNEVLLGISMYRARQPAHDAHPMGHRREMFLWALIAALASFLIGGCVSVALAIRTMVNGGEATRPLIAWIVLAVSFIADGASWIQSMRQAREQAREYGLGVREYLLRASDPVVRAVVVEDSAALIGLLIAGGGLLITQLTKSDMPDAIASLLIGILLGVTAVGLARPLADFLVGRSMHAEDLQKLRAIIDTSPAVESIVSLRAVYTGPEEVIVAAKVRPAPRMTVEEITRAMDDLDRNLREASLLVADVFLDLTSGKIGADVNR